MIGRTIGRYKTLAKLGQGGMGEVYLAQDLFLDRRIALKFLPPSEQNSARARERFIREARAASAIDHPFVCKIYEAGEQQGIAYIAMEFVEGQTLLECIRGGPMPLPEAVRIFTEVSEALMRAHEKGIVHRDLKPTNIMVMPDGHVKLLDFGLAKRLVTEEDQTVTGQTLTQAGNVVGTLSYMAPEQLRAKASDARADIFSLGIILYEMVAGRHPFRHESSMETASAILREIAPPVSSLRAECPPHLDTLVAGMLAKDPGERFPSMGEVLATLRGCEISTTVVVRAATVPVPVLPSVAVLPFLNMSSDPEQEYFSDGITDDLIAQLSRISSMKVIARGSVMRYKNTGKDLTEIGRELRVRHILEGTVRRAGSRVRIVSSLVDAESNLQVWTQTFDRELTDVFDIQAEVARQIAGELSAAMSSTGSAVRPAAAATSPEVYQLYLKGRYFLNKFTPESIEKGIGFFRKALDMEPLFALAYAGISTGYVNAGHFDYLPPAEAFPKARAAARRALEIDERVGEAHMSTALVMMFYEWNWEGAETAFRRSLQLLPNNADARMFYSWYLCMRRRFAEAVAEARLATDLDPLSPFAATNYGWVLSMAGDLDGALEQYARTLELEPDYPPVKTCMAWVYWARGKFAEAVELLRHGSWRRCYLAQSYAMAGDPDAARRELEEIAGSDGCRGERASEIALVYLAIGDRSKAAEWLETAFERRDYMVALQAASDYLCPQRSDPLVRGYIERMGLAL